MDVVNERLILLPGLGVDHRLFIPQQDLFQRLEVPTWIPPQPFEPLAQYAERFAETIRVEAGERYFLGGASFGGMLALEIARTIVPPPRAVFLIASCRSSGQLAPRLRVIERGSRWVPDWFIRAGQRFLPLLVPDLRHLSEPRRDLFMAMVRDTEVGFLRWGSRAVFEWNPDGPPDVPIHQIHGAEDTLIPVRNLNPDRVVHGVGHLLNMSRPEDVNDFLTECLRRYEA